MKIGNCVLLLSQTGQKYHYRSCWLGNCFLVFTEPASSAATTRTYSRTGFLSCKLSISTKSRFSIFHQISKKMKIPTLKIEKSGVLLLTTPASSAATTRAYSRTGFLSCKRAISTKSRFSIFHQFQKSWKSPLKIENCVVLLLATPFSSAATTLVYSGSHSNFCWDGKPPEVSRTGGSFQAQLRVCVRWVEWVVCF